jgi:hypothetical protein
MGMWALAPWDNDEAADWYGDFMDRTKLREAWLEGIREDPSESPSVVRAAGALFVMLGRVYVWPINNFDEDLELSIAALSSVAACAEYQEDPELVASVNQEIEELKSRRKPNKQQVAVSKGEQRPWWKFWQ